MKRIILFIILILFTSLISASPSINYLSKGQADYLYCRIAGDCILNSLIVQNLSVIGGFFNVSVINFNITSYVFGENASFHNVTVRNKLFAKGDIISADDIVVNRNDATDISYRFLRNGDKQWKFFSKAGSGDDFNIARYIGGVWVDDVMQIEKTDGTVLFLHNITAEEYFGLFNWWITPGVSTQYLTFNKSHLAYNESKLNETILASIPASTGFKNHTPINVSYLFVNGTLYVRNDTYLRGRVCMGADCEHAMGIFEMTDTDYNSNSETVRGIALSLYVTDGGDIGSIDNWFIGQQSVIRIDQSDNRFGRTRGGLFQAALFDGHIGGAEANRELTGLFGEAYWDGDSEYIYGDVIGVHGAVYAGNTPSDSIIYGNVYGVKSKMSEITTPIDVRGVVAMYGSEESPYTEYGYYQSGVAPNTFNGNVGIGINNSKGALQIKGDVVADGFNGTLNGNVNGGNGSFYNATIENDLFVGNDIWATGHTAARFIRWDKARSSLNIVGGGPAGRKALNVSGSADIIGITRLIQTGIPRTPPFTYALSIQDDGAAVYLQMFSSVLNDEGFFFGQSDIGSIAGNPAGELWSTEGPLIIYAANDNDAGAYNDILELQANNASFDGDVIVTGNTIAGDGGTTDYTEIKADGEINLHGTARVIKEVTFKAQSAAKGASAPTDALRALGASGGVLMPVVEFSKVTQQDVHGEFHMPYDVDNSVNVEFHLMWIPGAAWTTGNYSWNLEYLIKEESGNTTIGTPTTILMGVTPNNSTDIIETKFTDTIDLDAEQVLFAHIYRDVANDNGDDTGDVLFGEIQYTSNKLGEAT